MKVLTLASTNNNKQQQELVSTKLHLASDKIAQDNMACELVTTKAALLAKGTTRSEDDGIANFNHEAIGYTTMTVSTMVVPTMDPFSRKKTQKKKTVLNPGSCSSAMNLLNIMSLSSNVSLGGSSIDVDKSSSSTVYYHVHKKIRSTSKKNLNPGSCASALNLFDMVFDESQQQRGGSMYDITFRFGGGAGNNHALSSSLPRRSSSLASTTSGGLPPCRRRPSRSSNTSSLTRFNDNGKRNAEWGELK